MLQNVTNKGIFVCLETIFAQRCINKTKNKEKQASVVSMAKLPLDVMNNLDLIIERDTTYITRGELEKLDNLLIKHIGFTLAMKDFLLMFTGNRNAGMMNYQCESLLPNHSGFRILKRCHDGTMVKISDLQRSGKF